MPLPLIAATLGFVLATQGQPPPNQAGRPGGRNRAAAAAAVSGPDGQTAPVAPIIEIPTSVTHHSIDLPTGSISYTATAEQIPLKSDTGDVECRMFAVSYTKDDVAAHSRPVTFAFNGGPGSATLWLHMGTLGPKRAPLNDDGTMPNPPFQAIDNNDTWLDFTDVVVIDAPGTGFSRLAKPELGSKYFGVQNDLNAFTTFIRNWLTIHKRWTSPLFIAGESYGGIRGSGLSDRLYQGGIALNGFVSISGTSNFMTLDNMRGNDTTYISFFPSMADVAWYHHKSGTGLSDVSSVFKAAQKWTDYVYAPALERGDSLSPSEKDHIAAQMSKFLGIDKKYCLAANLRVSEFQFFRQLLRDDYLTIGRYDGRLIGKEELGVGDRGSGDPSDDAITAPITSSFNDYLETDLGVKAEIPYLNFGNVYPWTEQEGGYSETASDLRHVLSRNQHFRVMYCCGYYDLACPIEGTVYTVNHMGLDPETRTHVSFEYYPAGHMMYIEKSSRHKLHEDVKRFEADALAGK